MFCCRLPNGLSGPSRPPAQMLHANKACMSALSALRRLHRCCTAGRPVGLAPPAEPPRPDASCQHGMAPCQLCSDSVSAALQGDQWAQPPQRSPLRLHHGKGAEPGRELQPGWPCQWQDSVLQVGTCAGSMCLPGVSPVWQCLSPGCRLMLGVSSAHAVSRVKGTTCMSGRRLCRQHQALLPVAGQRAAGDASIQQPVFCTCLAAILSVCLSHGAPQFCGPATVLELQLFTQILHSKAGHCPSAWPCCGSAWPAAGDPAHQLPRSLPRSRCPTSCGIALDPPGQ